MLRRPWLLNLILLAAIAAAGIRLVTYLRSPLPELPGAEAPAAEAGGAVAETALPARAPAAPPEGDFSVIAAQDLFSQTRGVAPPKPPAAATAAPAKVTPPAKITLYGVVIVDGEKSAFLVEGGGDAKPRKVHEGESFAGGTVRAIRADGVTLALPSGEVSVALRTPKEGGGPVLSVPMAPGVTPRAIPEPAQRRYPAAQQRRVGTVPAVPVPGATRRPGAVQARPQGRGADEGLDEGDDDESYLDEEEDYYDEGDYDEDYDQDYEEDY